MMGTGETLPDHRAGQVHAQAARPVDSRSRPARWATSSANIKTLHDVHIGDTVTLANRPAAEAAARLPPAAADGLLRLLPRPDDAVPRSFATAWRSCSSTTLALTFEPINSEALGFGFRCGFLGLLHMEIVQERLEREHDIEVVQTAPTVPYEVLKTDGDGRSRSTPPASCPTPATSRRSASRSSTWT